MVVSPATVLSDPIPYGFSDEGLTPGDPPPVRWQVKEISESEWVLSNFMAIIRQTWKPRNGVSWRDGLGGHFKISFDIKQLFQGGQAKVIWLDVFHQTQCLRHAGATWKIGEATLEVIAAPTPATKGYLNDTLKALEARRLSFQTPKVLWYSHKDGYDYILSTLISGTPLSSVWSTFGKAEQTRAIESTALAIQELAFWKGTQISNVSGQPLQDNCFPGFDTDNSPEHLLKAATENCMKTDPVVFSHNRISLNCLFVNQNGSVIGIQN